MAKKYGGRWQIVDGAPLGSGGQGTVFRVTDITMQYEGEFALKRIPDTSRRDRFRREVEAIKQLTHPNVIPLIDHSALDETDNPKSNFLSCRSRRAVISILQGG